MKMLIFLLLFPAVNATDIYRSYDEQGNVVFTDTPTTQQSEKIKVESAFIYSPVEIPRIETTNEMEELSIEVDRADIPTPDYQVQIVSPADDEAIRANDGNITVNVQVFPALNEQRKDLVQLRRNGEPFGRAQSGLSFPLNNMDRGTHKFTVTVLNASGEVIAMSPAVSFHVLRNSIITNPSSPSIQPVPNPLPSPQ